MSGQAESIVSIHSRRAKRAIGTPGCNRYARRQVPKRPVFATKWHCRRVGGAFGCQTGRADVRGGGASTTAWPTVRHPLVSRRRSYVSAFAARSSSVRAPRLWLSSSRHSSACAGIIKWSVGLANTAKPSSECKEQKIAIHMPCPTRDFRREGGALTLCSAAPRVGRSDSHKGESRLGGLSLIDRTLPSCAHT